MSEFDEFFAPTDDEIPFGDPGTPEEERPALTPVDENKEQANSQNTQFEDDIYKKWFRTKDKQGFLSLRGWLSAGKISIDIGELAGGSPNNTQVWCDAIPFATYLRAVSNGTAKTLYPAGNNLPAESYVHYGGTEAGGNAVSRVLKVNYWQRGDQHDENAFAYKAGHFKGRKSSTGAFIPDMNSPLSVNMIKLSRVEVAEMSYRLDLAIANFAFRTSGDIFRALNGNNR